MKLINEIIPPMNVMADYAKSRGLAFNTYHDIQKVIAHYKNFGSILN